MKDETKAAEKRAYARGYEAGKRRLAREDAARKEREERQAFKDAAFLAVLPSAFEAQGWKMDGAPVTNTEQRVDLAWRVAREALKQRFV